MDRSSTTITSSPSHPLHPLQHHTQTAASPYDTDTDTDSILAPSTITPDHPTPSQASSTFHLLSSPTSQSNLRAHSITSIPASTTSSTSPLNPSSSSTVQRRATVAYLADLRAARAAHPKPKKTKGRRTFELLSNVVDFVLPLDIDERKTSMKESSLGRVVRRGEKRGGVGERHVGGPGVKSRTEGVEIDMERRGRKADVGVVV